MKKTGLIVAIVILFILVIGAFGGGYYLYTEIEKTNDRVEKMDGSEETADVDENDDDKVVYGTSTEVTEKTIYKEGEAEVIKLKTYTSRLGYKMLYNDEYFEASYNKETDTFTNEDGKVTIEITNLDKSLDSIVKENEKYNPTKTSYGYSITFPNDYDKSSKLIHHYIKDGDDDVFKIVVSYPLSDWTSYFEGIDPEITEYIKSFEIIEV